MNAECEELSTQPLSVSVSPTVLSVSPFRIISAFLWNFVTKSVKTLSAVRLLLEFHANWSVERDHRDYVRLIKKMQMVDDVRTQRVSFLRFCI